VGPRTPRVILPDGRQKDGKSIAIGL
jgi:hypothetical protein